MKTEGIKRATRKIGQAVSRNSPTILTGLSVAGLVTTVVLAVRATPKALQILEEEHAHRWNNPDFCDLTKKEIVQLTWRCYVPSAIMGSITIACIIGTNSINLKRNAALASLYSLAETTLKEYQAKVVETIGEKKAKAIKDEVYKDKIKNHPVVDKEVFLTKIGDTLCYDVISGRYFKSDIESIRKIQNDLNRRLISDMYISLNEIYYALGLPSTKMGEEVGWVIEDGMLDFNFSSQLTDNGTPCLVIDYTVGPRYDFNEMI